MGSDDLHHKRNDRKAHELSRRKASRKRYDKVLIVCEGEKTEPLYFQGLADHYKLNSANVEICSDGGTDPIGIVKFGKRRYKEEHDAGDPFDRVYLVFDEDGRTQRFQDAREQAKRYTPKNTFFAIASVPCFEYWILLHYDYSTKPYRRLLGNSACQQLCNELRTHMPNYSKSKKDIFKELLSRIEVAKNNSEKSSQAAVEADTDNPSTNVHELVDYLQKIKES